MNNKTEDNHLKQVPLHLPGQSAQQKYNELRNEIFEYWLAPILALAFFLFFGLITLLNYLLDMKLSLFFSLILLLILAVLYALLKSKVKYKELKSWKVGYKGEQVVGNKLEELRKDRCEVFHDIVISKGQKTFNIDHLIIASSGIYIVETKTRNRPKYNPSIIDVDIKNKIVKFANKKSDKDSLPQLLNTMKHFDKELFLITKEKYETRGILVYTDWNVEKTVPKIPNI